MDVKRRQILQLPHDGCVSQPPRAQTTFMRTSTPSSNAQLMGMWWQRLSQLDFVSTVSADIQENTTKFQLVDRVIDAVVASTLFRYCSYMSKFLITCKKLQLDVATLTAVQLLDIFLIGSRRTGLDPSMTLKALIWFGHIMIGSQINWNAGLSLRFWQAGLRGRNLRLLA